MLISMGIIKIEVSLPEAVRAIEEFRRNRIRVLEAIGHEVTPAVSSAINQPSNRDDAVPSVLSLK